MLKKILIIDDSALMRRAISDIIHTEPDKYTTETAENGEIAARLLEEHNEYDLMLVDINMPKMNGIRFLEFLSSRNYMVPTLIVSSIASRSAAETIRALELGAFDFVKKPDGMRGTLAGEFKEQLLTAIQCVFDSNSNVNVKDRQMEARTGKKGKGHHAPEIETRAAEENRGVKAGRERAVSRGRHMLFIASSTGGPKALQSVVPRLPADIGCPVVVVQHMPEGFTASLAERLNEMSPCEVVEAADGMLLKDGVVYVAKGGYQLRIYPDGKRGHRLAVCKEAARNGLRPCADIFLESLTESEYQKIYCAVLTGMGSDGTNGLIQLKKMKEVYTVGQSKETCVVYGMPRAAAGAGLTDVVADLQEITGILTRKMMS